MTLDPWRKVISDNGLYSGRGSVLGPDTSRRTSWYELELECGHQVERTVKYKPRERPRRGGTQHRSLNDVLPPPTRVRCAACGRLARKEAAGA